MILALVVVVNIFVVIVFVVIVIIVIIVTLTYVPYLYPFLCHRSLFNKHHTTGQKQSEGGPN